MTNLRTLPSDWLQYYQELLRTWTHRAGSRQDAEDATHDVLTMALEGKITTTLVHPRGFLHRCVRNRLTDQHRRAQILDTLPLHSLHETDQPTMEDPDAHIRNSQLIDSLTAALAELPLKCRQVFIWQKIEGYSQEEIAQRLDISVNMVQKYMIRALRHLRDRLQHYSPH